MDAGSWTDGATADLPEEEDIELEAGEAECTWDGWLPRNAPRISSVCRIWR